MPETTKHKLRYPNGGDAAKIALYLKELAEDSERELDDIDPSQITGVAKKQLLIANAAGVVTAVTPSGDVTNDESGAFTIGAGKVGTSKLADKSVTTAKLDDGAVVEGKMADGSVTPAKLAAAAVETAKIKDGAVTLAKTSTGATGLAAGAFSVYRNAAFSLGGVVPFDTEEFDVSGWHDIGTHKGRYTPQVAGYYSFHTFLAGGENVIGEGHSEAEAAVYLLKNGARYKLLDSWASDADTYDHFKVAGTAIALANGSTDYFEIELALNGLVNVGTGSSGCWFQGHLIGKS